MISSPWGKPYAAYACCPGCGEKDIILFVDDPRTGPQKVEVVDGKLVTLQPGNRCNRPWCGRMFRVEAGRFA